MGWLLKYHASTTKTKTEEKTTMTIDNDETKATGAAKADDAK